MIQGNNDRSAPVFTPQCYKSDFPALAEPVEEIDTYLFSF